MATEIATPPDAVAAFLAVWPAIVEECRSVWGSELRIVASDRTPSRSAGNAPYPIRDERGDGPLPGPRLTEMEQHG